MSMNRFRALQFQIIKILESETNDIYEHEVLAFQAGRMSLLADLIEGHVFEDVGLDEWYEDAHGIAFGDDDDDN